MSRRSRQRADAAPQPTEDWKAYRPAIWLAMLGVAVMILVTPFFWGALFLGAALGVAIRIYRRRTD